MATAVVVMVPLPAQGHLNQLLHLSRLVAAYGIPVHYACTAAHIRQAKARAHGWDPLADPIHFHSLPIPEFQSPIPNPNPSSASKFPSHLQPLFDSVRHLRRPLADLLRSLARSAGRVVVVHDSMMSSVVQDVASIPNAESYVFHSISAFSIFWYFWEALGKPFPVDGGLYERIPSLEDCFTPEFMEFIVSEQTYLGTSSGCLYNTCRAVEGDYMDLIEKMSESENQKHWAIGPFNPVTLTEKKNPDKTRPECLRWLDNQAPKSVILVSFGTTSSFPDDQIREIAAGLDESGLNFLWILREADRGDLSAGAARKPELPVGFEERVRGRGIVVRDWAPQLEVLAHAATGAFLSHCGWNSCVESISMGVPIATWPMHSDQPRNAALVTEVLRVGVVVKGWEERGGTVASATVSGALRRLMGAGEGEEIRRRAWEMGGAVRRAAAEGGAARLEMDSFVDHIRR